MSGTVRTKSGRVLTDADFERMADEAEKGVDVSGWEPRPGRPSLSRSGRGHSPRIGARVSEQTYVHFVRRVRAEGKTASEVVRDLVDEYASKAPSGRGRTA